VREDRTNTEHPTRLLNPRSCARPGLGQVYQGRAESSPCPALGNRTNTEQTPYRAICSKGDCYTIDIDMRFYR